MDPTVTFVLLCVAAHTWAIPILSHPGMNETRKRFERELSEEYLFQNEMTAMDKIMMANEFRVEGDGFREGDIAVSKSGSRSCFARSCLWPKSVDGHVYIAYMLSPEYTDLDRMTIQDGMESIENGTCIRFVPWTHQVDYLDIQPKSGCWSYLGVHGGAQTLSLQAPDCITSGVTAHELMHALGFVHEHSRADRDKYITIQWANIWKEHVKNFEKYRTSNLDTPYDYGSIMHFGKYAYSEDGDPTILPKKNPNAQLGQRFGPSELDKFKINKLYKCGV
ncbi:low choriolytic enzyme [Scleropages formosus]|uniref:low choriolytic enzyme n=1 Tax=Scleropages formosus TaxID=113540 RepID=UPI0010FAA8B0|nr:low choriolytic enzyme-like [Scleropages formosus]